MIERLEELWCKLMHSAPMWPMHGRYECRECGRHYPVEWAWPAEPQPQSARAATAVTWKLARASK